jgi:sulfur transfer complex TusBCD TusB component (DsrH family)
VSTLLVNSNWTTFGPDVIVALIGAGITLTVAGVTYFRQLNRKNRQLVFNLAEDLAVRRALHEIEPRTSSGRSPGAKYCFASVHAAQQRIGAIRDQIAPNEALRSVLHDMVRYCADYKESFEEEPRRWQYNLMHLRRRLVAGLRQIEGILGLDARALPEPGLYRPQSAKSDNS